MYFSSSHSPTSFRSSPLLPYPEPFFESSDQPMISIFSEVTSSWIKQKTVELSSRLFLSLSSLTKNSFEGQPAYPKLSIKRVPHKQCLKRINVNHSPLGSVDATEKKPSISVDLPKSFIEDKEQKIAHLIELGIPLEEGALNCIYEWMEANQSLILNNSDIAYPALFEGSVSYLTRPSKESEEGKKITTSFALEVHSNQRILLLFLDHPQAYIDKGGFKRIFKAYVLTKPKILAYAISIINRRNPTSAALARESEEVFLSFLNRRTRVVKVYEIFYYQADEQRIVMKYCPDNLLLLSNELICRQYTLSEKDKFLLSLKLLETLVYLHANKIIHRDLKPENILLDSDEPTITDFGLACFQSDQKALKSAVGSLQYLAPEGWLGTHSLYGPGLDVWSAGCILWTIWHEKMFPWYEFKKLDINQRSQALKAMQTYHQKLPHPGFKIKTLLWNMLNPAPQQRWTAQEALDYLKNQAVLFD